jgi:hypothetical protein
MEIGIGFFFYLFFFSLAQRKDVNFFQLISSMPLPHRMLIEEGKVENVLIHSKELKSENEIWL